MAERRRIKLEAELQAQTEEKSRLQAEESIKKKVNDMLSKEPELTNDNEPKDCLTTWRKLGPLTVDLINQHNHIPTHHGLQYREENYASGRVYKG